jgi:hypothetical protein
MPEEPKVRPPLDLSSVFAKLDRAEEHFHAVHREISEWQNLNRYETFSERGVQTARVGIGVQRVGPPPDLIRWSVIIGDCVNNLRSSLDHLIYAIAKYQAAHDLTAKIDNLAFVIADTPDEFKNAKARLKVFTPAFVELVESFQPYKRPHPALRPLLAILRDLSNADKHRLLQVAGAGVADFKAIVTQNAEAGTKIPYINPNPIKGNDVVCVVESSESDPSLAFHSVAVRIEVAIWHGRRSPDDPPNFARTAYEVLLQFLINEVRYVIDTFKMIL